MDDRERDLRDEQGADEQDRPRPRPRVIDKRVSARGPSGDSPVTPVAPAPPGDSVASEASASTEGTQEAVAAQTSAPSAPAPGSHSVAADGEEGAAGGAGGAEEPLWTPEQEEQARRMMEEMAQVPSLNWVLQAAMELVNVASVKLNSGRLDEASLPIDALGGIVDAVGPRLADAEAPLRQTLSQLRVAYAEMATAPPQQP